MKRLKIWFLADSYYGTHGGTEKQLLMLIHGLFALGHDVRLFVLRHTEYSRSATAFPCPIEAIDAPSIRSLRALRNMWNFRRSVERERPDVVHAYFNDAAILGPLFCRTMHTAVVTSRRDMGFWYDRSTLAMLRVANRRISMVVCNAQAVARQVELREKLARSRLRVIYNGLEDQPMQSTDREQQAVTDEIAAELANGAVRICLLANVRRIKRIEDFVEASAQLRDAFPQSRFLVIGHPHEPSYQSELQALAVRLRVTDRLQFNSALTEPIDVLRACHIGVLTSESEGLSNAILEYMRAGLPVVCSNTGGNPELVTHGYNGLLYQTGNVSQLSGCLEELCRDPGRRAAMAAASMREQERFSVSAMTDAHLKAYSELRCEA